MSYTAPRVQHQESVAAPAPNRGGRPLLGKERKVERTVSMDKPLDKILERLSNYEGLRLDKNVSTASICVHLMTYALSHVRDNAIFPTSDGKGLAIDYPANLDGPVAKALREILNSAAQEDAQ